MKHKIAWQYDGYLMESLVAIDDECDKLDITLLTEHFWSGGSCEPIESVGMKPLYRFEESIELPIWCNVRKYYNDYYYRAIVLEILQLNDFNNSLYEKLTELLSIDTVKCCIALLKVKKFRSTFLQSLRLQLDQWLNGNGKYDQPFSYRQLECIIDSYHIRMKR
jgi:hypothetical protein